jgi:hypothetical protein
MSALSTTVNSDATLSAICKPGCFVLKARYGSSGDGVLFMDDIDTSNISMDKQKVLYDLSAISITHVQVGITCGAELNICLEVFWNHFGPRGLDGKLSQQSSTSGGEPRYPFNGTPAGTSKCWAPLSAHVTSDKSFHKPKGQTKDTPNCQHPMLSD